MRSIGGLPFVFPGCSFSDEEERLLEMLSRLNVPPFVAEPFVIERSDAAPPPGLPPPGEPAVISFAGDRIRIAHADGAGELDLLAHRGTCTRFTNSGAPLRAMLRTAVVAMLPLHGGLPLHAAGLVADDRALVLFGESGAGKTTIASIAGLPVLSDEIVAVTVEDGRPVARSTGFGDEVYTGGAPGVARPVAALVQLAKADRFAVTPLSHAEATRALLKVILSPPHPRVWTRAIATLGAILSTQTPVVRMAWPGDRTPIPDLLALLECGAIARAIRPACR
ncbi:MAG TPA: hypothetical protein VF432_27340 [Thermoanaerobaculia bacterium]